MTLRRILDALGGAVKAKKLTIKDEDLTEAALTQEFAMGSLPAGAIVLGYDVNVKEAFAGTTTLVVDLGDGGGAEYADDVDLKTAARSSAMIAEANSDGNGVDVTALVTATVEDVVDASAGEVDVRVFYIESDQIPVK